VCFLINSYDAAAQISGQSSARGISDPRTKSVYAQDVGSLHEGGALDNEAIGTPLE
jgi:hypothetical protein